MNSSTQRPLRISPHRPTDKPNFLFVASRKRTHAGTSLAGDT